MAMKIGALQYCARIWIICPANYYCRLRFAVSIAASIAGSIAASGCRFARPNSPL
jgi:hypothetical protein